jgi:peptide-methionine (S)-S-oxide reductase
MEEQGNEAAILGGGCFWCLEAAYQEVEGVLEVQSGYAGGHVSDPTYKQVCTGTTGHAEVVRVVFDPRVVTYREILEIFFAIHDPTTPDRQGADVGPQYRSIILTADEEQDRVARETIQALDGEGPWDDPVVTEVAPLETFYPAEAVHDDYYRRNPRQPYCQVVISPKLAKFRRRFAHKLRDGS